MYILFYLICMSSPTQNCLEKSLVAEAAWRAQRAFRTPTRTDKHSHHITRIRQQCFHHHKQQAAVQAGWATHAMECDTLRHAETIRRCSQCPGRENFYEFSLDESKKCLPSLWYCMACFHASKYAALYHEVMADRS